MIRRAIRLALVGPASFVAGLCLIVSMCALRALGLMLVLIEAIDRIDRNEQRRDTTPHTQMHTTGSEADPEACGASAGSSNLITEVNPVSRSEGSRPSTVPK